jgi:hypothetical protein
MSDHGDYKEPKAGDWMLVVAPESGVIAPEGGEVACLKVLSIGDGVANPSPVATMTDGSLWAVETGAAMHRKWAGCTLWPFDSSFARGDVADLLDDASEGAVAEVYGILLADREARKKAKGGQ